MSDGTEKNDATEQSDASVNDDEFVEMDEDAEAGFAEEVGDDSAGGKDDKEDPVDDEGDDEEEAEEEDDEGDSEEDSEEKDEDEDEDSDEKSDAPDEDKAVKDRIAEIKKEKDGGKEDEDKDDTPQAKKDDVAFRITKEDIRDLLRYDPESILPKGDIVIGDKTFNFDTFREDYADDIDAMTVMSGLIAEGVVNEAVKRGSLVTAETFKEKLQAYDKAINTLAFDLGLKEYYSDWRKIIERKDFVEWKEKQGSDIDLLYYSDIPEDGKKVLDLFFKSVGKKTVMDVDEKRKAKHKKRADVHKHTSKPSAGSGMPAGEDSDNDDAEAGFLEEAKSISG